MRTRIAVVTISIILTVLSYSQSLRAQKFKEPTKEELQMTSDPKAPGAPAVFLYREEVTDNYSHYVSSYARIKVLTELGKEWAHVEFVYNPGESAPPIIEARTIHSDGTVIPLVGKVDDIVSYKLGRENAQIASFSMPSVEVGSILEYRWTIRLTSGKLNFPVSDEETPLVSSWVAREIPVWKVQQEIYVHKEHFYYNPLGPLDPIIHTANPTDINGLVDGERSNFLFNTQHLPPGAQFTFTPKHDYVFDIQNVPPIPHPFASPAEGTLAYQVIFFYCPAPTPEAYWELEIKRWSKILSHATDPTPDIKEVALQITASEGTPDAKAHKLYDAIQAFENTDFRVATTEINQLPFTLLGTRQKRAEDVWKAKAGNSNDLAMLYLALARAAGLEAYGVQVADRSERSFDPNYLSLRQLRTLLVVVHVDGKDVVLDPGEKLCPYGQLHPSHMLAGGVSQASKMPIFTPGNLSKDAITAHSVTITLDALRKGDGVAKLLMTGPEALRWRQINLRATSSELKDKFNKAMSELLPKAIAADLDHFDGLDKSVGNLLAVVHISGQIGTVSGNQVRLPAFLFSSGVQFTPEVERTVPIDFHYSEQVIDDVIYHLPAGYVVENAPQPVQLAWPEHAALVTKTALSSDGIEIKHIFARASVLMDAKEYPYLRNYYEKLSANDQQQLVLTRTAAAAGN